MIQLNTPYLTTKKAPAPHRPSREKLIPPTLQGMIDDYFVLADELGWLSDELRARLAEIRAAAAGLEGMPGDDAAHVAAALQEVEFVADAYGFG